MAQTSYPFTASTITQAQWQSMAKVFAQSGVVGPTDLTVASSGATMVVTTSIGAAFVEGFYYNSDAVLSNTITAANATLSRIDTVALRMDRTANTVTVVVVNGTAAASPVQPTLNASATLFDFPLANVLVDPAVGVIASNKVTDRRTFTTAGTNVPMSINFMFRGNTQTGAFQEFIAPYTFTLTGHRARIASAGILIPQVFKNGSALSAGTQNVTSAGQVDTYGPNIFLPGDVLRVSVISQSDTAQSDLVVTMNAKT